MQEYLGTQVSTDIRQPDLVFSKKVLIHLFSFLYSVAANNALKNGSSAWAAAAATPPTACSPLPSILHASPTLSCSGGNLQKGAMDGQWRWEKCPRFIPPGSTLNCAKPTQPTKQTQAGCEIPKFGGFSWDQTLGTWIGSPTCRRRWLGASKFFFPAPKCLCPTGIQGSERRGPDS